jgi:Uma2 family endonuclease
MTAAPVASPPGYAADACVIVPRVSWETYERLLSDDEGRRTPKMAYDRGVLELVTPSMPHSEDAQTIARMVDIVAAMLGIPVRSAGDTTYRRQDLESGFEPDASFYIQSEPLIRGRRQVDLSVDPPPDVVVEMELSRSALDKLPLFASMGIPEVWRCDGQRVTILLRDGETYCDVASSLALPVLTSDVLTRFLTESRTRLSPDWFRAVSQWAEDERASVS